MLVSISGPDANLIVRTESLSQAAFSTFGAVIENPEPSLIPSSELKNKDIPVDAVLANQGSALKYLDVTHMRDLYQDAPSTVQSKAVMNMFVCAPRQLANSYEAGQPAEDYFHVRILERHPYTTQTFIPLGVSAAQSQEARYLVIVAPSLPPSPADESLPVPVKSLNGEYLPGRGLPDLKRLKAFIADGSQAVTYGAGTWHAPMVVVGIKAIDFVVVQFANGVGTEDCQEASLEERSGGKLTVVVPKVAPTSKL